MPSPPFPHLFMPGHIGTLRLKNRLVMSPMYTGYAGRDGTVTPRLLAHYRERAGADLGLVICEYAYVDTHASKAQLCQLGIYDDECIAGLARLAETIKHAGASAGAQISHSGRQRFDGEPIVAPSRIPWERPGVGPRPVPRELTVEEIREIVEAYGQAARRVKQAGFDLLEIHGGHGYLITQFLSRHTNRRTDLYGGELGGRMRFLLEVVDRARANVGPDFPLSVRLSWTDFVDSGLALADTVQIAQALERAGVDAIHVSAGTHESTEWQVAPTYQDLALNVEAAAELKRALRIPVLVVGSINSPELAAAVVREGKADFVTLGRALLADAHFARKARQGRAKEIRPCIRSNDGCIGRRRFDLQPTHCTVNFVVGRQDEFDEEIPPSSQRRLVVVVGGGPAGLEAARVAARRGHRVVLFERQPRLGGWLLAAAAPAFKADLRRYVAYLVQDVERVGVDVRHEQASAEQVAALGPDVVILAAGSAAARPGLRGADLPHVVLATDVLAGRSVGERVVVAGGDQIVAETVIHLARAGARVQFLQVGAVLAPELDLGSRRGLERLLAAAGIEKRCAAELAEVTPEGIVAADGRGGWAQLSGDTVVLSPELRPSSDLLAPLEAHELEVVRVGDCIRPRRIYDAVHEGHIAARRV